MGFVGKEYNQSYMTYSVKCDGQIWRIKGSWGVNQYCWLGFGLRRTP